jgi:hypothetical protein
LEQNIAAIDKRRAAKATRQSIVMTQDALTQREEEATDGVWQREGSAVESESSLRLELTAFFEEKDLTTSLHSHKFFAKHFAPVKTMSYSTFNAFMKGSRTTPLKKDHKQQLQMLLANHHHVVKPRDLQSDEESDDDDQVAA